MLLRVILAFLVPPLALLRRPGPRVAPAAVSLVWLVGQAMFWLWKAGPGFAVALVASLAAVVLVVRAGRRGWR